VVEKFADKTKVDLSPSVLSNHEMGYVFEELIRKFNEALDENPGEHFTPREVIRLMVNLVTAHDRQDLQRGKVIRTVYDPCCGSGGMLTIAKERIRQINPQADVHLFGQEVNPQTFAVSKSDLYIKSADGRDAENIAFGSVLAKDGHADRTFDFLLANPPYGKNWELDQESVRAEAARATKNRFAAGLPRISDGQLLFLQHMLGRMHHPSEGTSRVSIIMNGSPLFTGDAGSGESEIRRWILENDYLDALIALPQQLFYNTGISTYVWVLSNNKPASRKGKVLLIDASEAWLLRQRSLGAKRRDIPDGVDRAENYIPYIVKLFEDFTDGTAAIPADQPKELRAKVFPTTAFGYRRVTIERPLRLNFQASSDRLGRVENARAFQNLAVSKKKDAAERAADEAAGRETQDAIMDILKALPNKLVKDRAAFLLVFDAAVKKAGLRLAAPLKRAILDALSERDETAAICLDDEGSAEPDPELRDSENVPLGEVVHVFFEKEVKPHAPDAWINESIRDEMDGEVGIVGYEINFNRYFYRYQPPRPLEEIEADIKAVETDVLRLLKEVAG
jgi:type I restriction enzyme M protein